MRSNWCQACYFQGKAVSKETKWISSFLLSQDRAAGSRSPQWSKPLIITCITISKGPLHKWMSQNGGLHSSHPCFDSSGLELCQISRQRQLASPELYYACFNNIRGFWQLAMHPDCHEQLIIVNEDGVYIPLVCRGELPTPQSSTKTRCTWCIPYYCMTICWYGLVIL